MGTKAETKVSSPHGEGGEEEYVPSNHHPSEFSFASCQ